MIRELLKIALLFFILFFLGRLGLYLLYFDRLGDIPLSMSLMSFIHGMRFDTMVICILLVIPTIILALTPSCKKCATFSSVFLHIYVLFFLIVALFIENATIPFVAQYDVRPNYLFIEYLKYPQEVSSMIFKEYPYHLLVAGIMIVCAIVLYKKYQPFQFKKVILSSPLWKRALLLPLIAVLLFLGIRSSFGHRPANISDALYSNNRIANEIAKNSLYSIGYAYRSYANEASLAKRYGKMNLDEAYERVSKRLNIPVGDRQLPFQHMIHTLNTTTTTPKNLVIFVQESMGSLFVGFSGGDVTITPNMEKLSHEGLAFTNLFSNGTRSIRGLAGMTSGWLPLVGEGVVKRNKSQRDFFTVASLLKPYGYKSTFIYGGEGRFDNMRAWYMGNGFDRVIEQRDFENPTFVSSWGVCDEDLVIKANEVYKEHTRNHEPFVSVMFSQSNHTPFELPEGKIDWVPNVPKRSATNAVKYADFAIGRFFELAKKEEYYKNTVFVVVADHNIRVYGDDVVPVNMFHIPGLIISDGMKAQHFDKLSTQPDVLATAIDLLGIDLVAPILGNSIFSDKKQEVSLMLFNDTFALRVKDDVAVLGPEKEAQAFRYENEHLVPKNKDEELSKDVLAFIIVLDDMYNKKLFRTKKSS